jgi:zinc protease
MRASRVSRGLHLVVTSAVFAAIGCGGGDSDRLPGHTRPILDHDWAAPSDLSFPAIGFAPPDPFVARFQSASGIQAYIVTDPAEPLVRLTAALPLGRLREGAGEAGASALLTQLLTTRGPARASEPLSLLLADLGAGLSAVETLDVTTISLDVLPEDWLVGLELLVRLLRDPDLDATAIRQYRVGSGFSMPMAGTGGSGFRPKVELERAVAGYPLAPPDPGTTVSLGAIRSLASRSLAANRVVLGVGGAVDRDEVQQAIDALSNGWSVESAPLPGLSAIEPNEEEGQFHAIDVPSLEGWVAIGRAVASVPSTDQATLAVLRFILAERLNIAAREMRGLANRDDFEIPVTGAGTGLMTVRTGGRPEAVAPLVRFSLDEIERLRDPSEPVSDEEIARAQGWLVNAVWQPTLGLATSASGAFALEHARRGDTDRLMGWPRAVRAVTAGEVKALADQYLNPESLVTVVVGPLARIREARHPRWPIGLDEVAASLSGGN